MRQAKGKGVASARIRIHGPLPGEPASYMGKSHRQTLLVLVQSIPAADSAPLRQSASLPQNTASEKENGVNETLCEGMIEAWGGRDEVV